MYRDLKKCIRSQFLAAELYDYETIPLYGYVEFGEREFGSDIGLPAEKGMAPCVTRHLVMAPEVIEKLEVPDFKLAGSLLLTIEAAKEASEPNIRLHFWLVAFYVGVQNRWIWVDNALAY